MQVPNCRTGDEFLYLNEHDRVSLQVNKESFKKQSTYTDERECGLSFGGFQALLCSVKNLN